MRKTLSLSRKEYINSSTIPENTTEVSCIGVFLIGCENNTLITITEYCTRVQHSTSTIQYCTSSIFYGLYVLYNTYVLFLFSLVNTK